MDFAVKAFFVCSAVLLIVGLVACTQRDKGNAKASFFSTSDPLDRLFDLCQKELKRFIVLKKNRNVLICAKDARGLHQEIAFLRIDPRQSKGIKRRGAFFVVTYRSFPSAREVHDDIVTITNRFKGK